MPVCITVGTIMFMGMLIGTPGIGIVLTVNNNNIPLYWTADGLFTEPPSAEA
jgi:hypothetical protein